MNRIILPARLYLPFHFLILTPPLLTSPLLSYPTLLLYTVVLAMVVVVLIRCKASVRACSSAQSRPSTPPLWSKVRILFTTLLTLTPMVYGACDATKCTPTPCNLTDRHLIVPNTVTAIAECKLVVVWPLYPCISCVCMHVCKHVYHICTLFSLLLW